MAKNRGANKAMAAESYKKKWGSDELYESVFLPFKAVVRDMERNFIRAAAKRLQDDLPPGTNATVLDIGCGDGELSQALFEEARINIVSYTGIDLNQKALAECKKRFAHAGKTKFINQDANSVAFPDSDSYDLISFIYSTYGVSGETLRKAAAALNKDGLLFVLANSKRGDLAKIINSSAESGFTETGLCFAEDVEEIFAAAKWRLSALELEHKFADLSERQIRSLGHYLADLPCYRSDAISHEVEKAIFVTARG